MSVIRLTKIFTFETAHALFGYDGKCKNIHGHSYRLFVTISGTPMADATKPKFGMIIDFGDLKEIVNKEIINKLDHAILLNTNTEHKILGETLIAQKHNVVFTEYQPTCENMLVDFAQILQQKLPNTVKLEALKLHETDTSYGEWLATDNI